jgi:hypothetical protein
MAPNPFDSIVASTNGQFLFAPDSEGADGDYPVRSYRVGQGGTLTLVDPGLGTEIEDVGVLCASNAFLIGSYTSVPYFGVVAYSIDSKTGALRKVGTLPARIPYDATLDPTREVAYVNTLQQIVAYSLASGHVGETIASSVLPNWSREAAVGSVRVTSDGRFLYASSGTTSVPGTSVYLWDLRGLAPGAQPKWVAYRVGAPNPAISAAVSLTVDPLNRFLAVNTGNALEIYDIDAASGALTLSNTVPVAKIDSIAITPVGQFMYLSQGDLLKEGALSAYAIEENGHHFRPIGSEEHGGRLTLVSQSAQ